MGTDICESIKASCEYGATTGCTVPDDELDETFEVLHVDANHADKASRKEATCHNEGIGKKKASSADRGAKYNTTCRSSKCDAEATCAFRDHDHIGTEPDGPPTLNGFGDFDIRDVVA